VAALSLDVAAAGEAPSAAPLMDDLMRNRGPQRGTFTMSDHQGKRCNSTEFASKLLVIHFGYTYCPDICPLDLTAIADAIERLGPDSGEAQPLFISVDPERDTPKRPTLCVSSIHS
jgi:cytochrome oxidase Cu insertion factor (SCO1/SenC/PrrC family)